VRPSWRFVHDPVALLIDTSQCASVSESVTRVVLEITDNDEIKLDKQFGTSQLLVTLLA